MPIFSGRTSSMGSLGIADPNVEKLVLAAANAPVTVAQAQRGKAELAKMKRSLVEWLRYRTLLDQVASGGKLPSIMMSPGQRKRLVRHTPASLRSARAGREQALATQLYQLLSETFDASSLPEPDIGRNPTAAVQLAQIAIAGKLPGEVTTPGAAAGLWMWPVVVVVGVIGFVIMTAIKSSADVAKEKERLECIKAGACTDTGFFLKVGAAIIIGWFAWDKLGLREKLKGAIGK